MFEDLIDKISPGKDYYSKELVLVVKLLPDIEIRIGDNEIYISEFVVAKILDFIPKLKGHPEVSKNFFLQLPILINNPKAILCEQNDKNKIYVICGDPTHRIVLEIKRKNFRTEINTIHRIRDSSLQKLKEKTILL